MAKKYKWIALDTETTGISFLKSQVIEVGAIFCDENMQEIERASWNINYEPTYEWTSGAEAVHGITKETALSHGVCRLDFITEFEDAIKNIYGKVSHSDLAGIGVQSYFDFVMMQNSLFEPFNRSHPISYKQVGDLSCLGYHITGKSALDRQLEHFGIECDNSLRHSAMYDAEMHLKLFRKLMG